MIPVYDSTHKEEALALLTDQFKQKPVIEGILTVLSLEIQELEDTFRDILTKRILDDAVGDQLDQIGAIVGAARLGRSDTDYRATVRLQIRINRSQGKSEDMIQVLALMTAGSPGETFTYEEIFPASFKVEQTSTMTSGRREIRDAIFKTKSAGVFGAYVYHTDPTLGIFRFASGDTPETSVDGFAHTNPTTVPGGQLTGVITI